MNKIITLLFSIHICVFSFAQMSGISYTLSPAAEYTWHDDISGLEDGFMAGGRFGFGFGQFIELRANYMKSLDLKTDPLNFALESGLDTMLVPKDLDMLRYGGEMKINLSTGNTLPYFTIGTGIQSIEGDSVTKHEQIYVAAGAGIKFSVGDRYTFGLQALNTTYNYNSKRNLLSPTEIRALDIPSEELTTERVSSWSMRAALQFYLGGVKPDQFTAVDQAYMDLHSSGFRGLSVPLEPTVAKIEFHEDLPYEDAWLAGGSMGLNFGPLIGVRGFYYRALEDGSSSKFDDLAIYGGEAKFKLSDGQGLNPYILLGGGKIDAKDGYEVEDSLAVIDDNAFASGGLGISIPFSRYFKITGFGKALLTSGPAQIEDISKPEEIKTSWMYGASLNLILGKKPEMTELGEESIMDKLLLSKVLDKSATKKEIEQVVSKENAELKSQISEAYLAGDLEKAKQLSAQVRANELLLQQIPQSQAYSYSTSVIQMTPAELQNIIHALNSPSSAKSTESDLNREINEKLSKIDDYLTQLEAQLDEIEKGPNNKKEDKKENSKKGDQETDVEELMDDWKKEMKELKEDLQKQLDRLERRVEGDIDDIEKDIEKLEPTNIKQPETILLDSAMINNPDHQMIFISKDQENAENKYQGEKGFFKELKYAGASGFVGFNIGGNATANWGFRSHYRYREINFVPESFFGFGNPSSFGLSINVTKDIRITEEVVEEFRPYAGMGLGFLKIGVKGEDKIKPTFNLIFGANLFNVGDGRFYVDWTARNLFKHNQLAAGYRMPF